MEASLSIGYRVFVENDENVLVIDSGDSYTMV